MSKYKPVGVFHPGEHLKDELDARGLSDVDFSMSTGIPIEMLRAILEGRIPMVGSIAGKIGSSLGTSADLWVNLNNAYYSQQTKTTLTLIHPKNWLCRFIIGVLGFIGVDFTENKYLTKKTIFEDAVIGEIAIYENGES